MKTSIVWITAAALLLIVQPSLQAQSFNKAGRATFQFLKIGIGARQTGMGEAGLSVVRDVNSIFWNPAGITTIPSAQASFSYDRWLADLNYLAGAVGFRVGDIGLFGLSYATLGYGDIPEALATAAGGSSDTRTGQSFTGNDMMLGLTFARQFTSNLSIGVTVKYLREKLFIYSANSVAFDVGTFYDTGFKGISFAMSAQNFSKSVNFLQVGSRKEGYDVPLLFSIGASIALIKPADAFITAGESNQFTIALETVNSNDYGERWHVGGEYVFADFLSLRAGYRFNYDDGNTSFGVGVHKQIGDMDVRVDYSYVSYQYLTSPQRVSLLIGF